MYMPSIFNNSVFDNFDNWMDFSFPSFNQRLYGASSSQLMKTDVKETDKDYEVSIDLPGFKKEELQIELKDGYLTVSGSKEVSSTEEPKENQKDLEEIPPHVLSQFKIVCVEQIEQVLENALTRMPEKRKS